MSGDGGMRAGWNRNIAAEIMAFILAIIVHQ
jgi:hypothetical protein